MFSGAYAHSVDSKGRTVIPVRFRARLGERVILTRGLNGCLWLFSEDEWREFRQAIGPKCVLDTRGLKLERFFVGNAVECTPDSQGRILIPQHLREYAGIVSDIWMVGLINKVEIWADDRWRQFNEDLLEQELQEIGEQLGLG